MNSSAFLGQTVQYAICINKSKNENKALRIFKICFVLLFQFTKCAFSGVKQAILKKLFEIINQMKQPHS